MRRKRLGELLLGFGLVTEAQVQQALAKRAPNERVGEALVNQGFITERALQKALAIHLKVPIVEVVNRKIHPSLLSLVPAEMAQRLAVLPIARQRKDNSESIFVATADPTNDAALEEVARHTRLTIEPMLAKPSELRAAIEQCYFGDTQRQPLAPVGDDYLQRPNDGHIPGFDTPPGGNVGPESAAVVGTLLPSGEYSAPKTIVSLPATQISPFTEPAVNLMEIPPEAKAKPPAAVPPKPAAIEIPLENVEPLPSAAEPIPLENITPISAKTAAITKLPSTPKVPEPAETLIMPEFKLPAAPKADLQDIGTAKTLLDSPAMNFDALPKTPLASPEMTMGFDRPVVEKNNPLMMPPPATMPPPKATTPKAPPPKAAPAKATPPLVSTPSATASRELAATLDMPPSLSCQKCGGALVEGAKFCGQCGNALTELKPAAEAEVEVEVPLGRAPFTVAETDDIERRLGATWTTTDAGAADAVESFLGQGDGLGVLRTVLAPVTLAEATYCDEPWHLIGEAPPTSRHFAPAMVNKTNAFVAAVDEPWNLVQGSALVVDGSITRDTLPHPWVRLTKVADLSLSQLQALTTRLMNEGKLAQADLDQAKDHR